METNGKSRCCNKRIYEENKVFADAFNFLIYDGEPVVKSSLLQELDTTEIAIPFETDNEDKPNDEVVQKYRDVLKSAVIMQDSRASYVLLGIENQTDVHYAMPVRNIIYDALQYGKQVTDIAARHKSQEHSQKHNRGEYLSGFYKEDRIRPVITLVIHFGANEWDGPLSLRDMMDLEDERLLEFVQDYRIFLIDPYNLTDKDLKKFSSTLGGVLGYIKYSKNKKEFSDFLASSPSMIMENDAARVIRDITNTPIFVPEGKGEIDVCKAVQDMIYEREEIAEIRTLVKQIRKGRLTIEEAAEDSNMTVEQFKEAMNKIAPEAV